MPDDATSTAAQSAAPQLAAPTELESQAECAVGTGLFMVAAGAAQASGLVLFGWETLRVLIFSCLSAVIGDYVVRRILRRQEKYARRRAVLVGMLVACTLPASAHWPVPVVAGGIGAVAGLVIANAKGRRLWHPAALGRVAVQIFFADQLSLARWPVLAPGYLLSGDLSATQPLPPLATWDSPPGFGGQAWEVLRPADVLAATVPAHTGASPAAAIAALVRDALPPWSHTLTGVAGGAIGEACAFAIIAVGLVLAWRGRARLNVPIMGVLAGGLLAAVLPVAIRTDDGAVLSHWLPGLAVWDGLPVGALYVLYHLTAGEFLLVLILLAADPSSSPSTGGGRWLFGAIIGGLTITLRVLTGVPAAGYWALLIANTLVPLMNHVRRRPS